MSKIIFHCGDFNKAAAGVEVLGDLTHTAEQMAAIGKGLRAPEGQQDRHVFSNSSDIAIGARVAIKQGDLSEKHFEFQYHAGGETAVIHVEADGALSDMAPGFFDQAEKDLIKLF